MPWMALCWSEKPDKEGDRHHRLARLHSFKNDEMCHCCLFLLCLWLVLDNDQSRSRHILGALIKAVNSVGFGGNGYSFGYQVLAGTRISSEYSASTRILLSKYQNDTRMIQTQVEFFPSLSMAHLFLKVPKPWFSSARKIKEKSGLSCLLSISKSRNMPTQGRSRLGQAYNNSQ